MLPYMTKETADVINNFEAGRLYEKALKAITSEPIKEAEEDLTQKEGKMATEKQDAILLVLKMEERFHKPRNEGKGKEMNSPLQALEGGWPA